MAYHDHLINHHCLYFDQAQQENPGGDSLFFIGDDILVDTSTHSPVLPLVNTTTRLHLSIKAVYKDNSHFLVRCTSPLDAVQQSEQGFTTLPIKSLLANVSDRLIHTLLRGHHWLNWDKQARYCSICGTALTRHWDQPEKHCATCEQLVFPRFSPAVMVLIHDNSRLLLARSPHFNPGIYSAIAGFINVGETAEQAAHREVKEEIGVAISNLCYFGTQTWPFPDSFMIAFTASYHSGDIAIDSQEIEDARWFNIEQCPKRPKSSSIANQLIAHAITLLKANR